LVFDSTGFVQAVARAAARSYFSDYAARPRREGFAVDASLIVADANKQRSIPGLE
jgi:hypothetical protein